MAAIISSVRPAHMLVVFEASKAGRAALEEAAVLARAGHARMTVLMMVTPDDPARCCGIQGAAWDAIQRQAAEEELSEAVETVSGAADLLVRMGSGREDLLAVAEELGADTLIEPGARRWRRSSPQISRLVSRSVAACGGEPTNAPSG